MGVTPGLTLLHQRAGEYPSKELLQNNNSNPFNQEDPVAKQNKLSFFLIILDLLWKNNNAAKSIGSPISFFRSLLITYNPFPPIRN